MNGLPGMPDESRQEQIPARKKNKKFRQGEFIQFLYFLFGGDETYLIFISTQKIGR